MKKKNIISTINLLGFTFLLYASYLFRKNQSNLNTENIKPIFTPASYSFGIWGLIFILLLIWIIKGYKVKAAEEEMYLNVGYYFVISMILTGTSVLVNITVSPFIIALSLIVTLIIYNIIFNSPVSRKFIVPFSLLSGWLSVATIVDISEAIKSVGIISIFGIGEITWTIILIVVGTIIAILFNYIKHDTLYPLVFIWGYIALIVENNDIKSVVYTAGLASLIILVCIIYVRFSSKLKR